MVDVTDRARPRVDRTPTLRVNLPGGQNRLRQLILHLAARCAQAERLDTVKLNKMLWRADFASFAARSVPVTGREYRRLESGPALREMPALRQEMQARGLVRLDRAPADDGRVEHRWVALVEPDLSMFSVDDLTFVDRSVAYYLDGTGMEPDDDSLGAAWRSRNDGDAMPYELALLSDRRIGPKQLQRLRSFIQDEGLTSL